MADTHLVYAEDLQPGMWLQYDKPPGPRPVGWATGIYVGPPREPEKGYALLKECRRYGAAVSSILINEDGEEQALIIPEYTLVRVRNTAPSLPDDITVADFEKGTST